MNGLEFDYIVVGGGSAGCVLAARLTEDPLVRVALLEAGPRDTSPLIHCPAGIAVMASVNSVSQPLETVPQAGLLGRNGYQPRGRTLGGSSSTNAMVYIRGQHDDYDQWAAMGNPGWAWKDVLPYFRKAEHNERLNDEWHGQNGPLNVADLQSPNIFTQRYVDAGVQAGFKFNPDFNGAEQEGVGIYQVTHKNGERFSAAKGYLTPNLHRPNLTVMTDTTAQRIVLQDGIARQVEILQGRQSLTLSARREIIVSSGTFQSPALLMRSGIGPGAHLQAMGIATQHDLPGVGENLHDHPDVVLVAEAPYKELFGISPAGAWTVMKGLWQWRQHRKGFLTTNCAEGGGFIKTRPELAEPNIQLHFVVGKLMDHGRKQAWGHGFSLHVCILQPKSRGTVRLASTDAHTPPLLDPQYLSHPDDMADMIAGVRQGRKILQAPALSQYGREWSKSNAYQTDAQLEQWIRQHTDTIYHPVGTCRMGQDPMAVVDAQLRVHGVPGLRVVDASVIPRIVSGNTNAPTIMLAEKAADLIRAS
jgi:choline dehydrogenase-like flavoprotein